MYALKLLGPKGMAGDDKYILSTKIARGGMAEIFLAKKVGEDNFQRVCCVKRILQHYKDDELFVKMFEDEKSICQQLRHANIVRVEDYTMVEDAPAIIMEYVDGPDLRTLLYACENASSRNPDKDMRLGLPAAIFIAAEVARGLHYAHQKKDEVTGKSLSIVHRDISPQNILISFNGEVKVTDFGIATAEDSIRNQTTEPGVIKGKYAYMSPEQVDQGVVDHSTDVFALGIVTWEMLAMHRLFKGTDVETLTMVKKVEIRKNLRALNPDVDDELYQIVLTALSKNKKDRYASAADYEKSLRRYLNKRFPDFSASDLGRFVSDLMPDKKKETQAFIKQTLTQSQLKRPATPGNDTAAKQSPEIQTGFQLQNPGAAQLRPQGGAPSSLSRKPPGTTVGQAPYGNAYQSQIRRPHMKHPHGSSHSRMNRSRSQQKSNTAIYLVALGVVLAAGAIFVVGGSKDWQAKKLASISLSPTPDRVRVYVNNTPYDNGRYQSAGKTGIQIPNLAPGNNQIRLSRLGYEDLILNYSLKEGENRVEKFAVLSQLGNLSATRIDVANHVKSQKIYYELSQGLEAGLLPAKLNLPSGLALNLSIRTPEPFTCRIKPVAANWSNPFRVIVNLKRKNCQTVIPR